MLKEKIEEPMWQMPGDVPWLPKVFSCMWWLSSSRTDSSGSGSTAKQEKRTAFFKVEWLIIDGSLYRGQETIAFPLYGHLMDV